MKLEVKCFEFAMDNSVPLRNLIFIDCPEQNIYFAIECFNACLEKFEVFYEPKLALRFYTDRARSFNKNGWNQQLCTADVEIDFDNSKDAENELCQYITQSINAIAAIVVLERVSTLLQERISGGQSDDNHSYSHFGAWS